MFLCQHQTQAQWIDDDWLDVRHCTDLESHTCYDVEYLVFLLPANTLRFQKGLHMALACSAQCTQGLFIDGSLRLACVFMDAAEAVRSPQEPQETRRYLSS